MGKALVGLLAVLGVVFILVCIVLFAVILSATKLESGYGAAVDAEYFQRMASEPRPPQWFPDGDLVAFSHAGSVYVVDSSGSNLHLVHGSDRGIVGYEIIGLAYGPSVSPDGSRIAYSAYEKSGRVESWEIMTARPDGSGQRRLTENNQREFYPVWSHDGTSIFFRSGLSAIGVMRADGSDSGLLAGFEDVVWSSIIGAPVLSPDGNHVSLVVWDMSGRKSVMYVVEVDGSRLTRLADETGLPAWSPDGSRLAFAKVEFRGNDNPYGTAVGIYTIGLDGSEPREIISFPTQSLSATNNISWSPDGSEMLFGGYVIAADGSSMRELPGTGKHASWSPDGSRIAVYNGLVTYTVARDGSDARMLVEQADYGSLVAAGGRPLE